MVPITVRYYMDAYNSEIYMYAYNSEIYMDAYNSEILYGCLQQ